MKWKELPRKIKRNNEIFELIECYKSKKLMKSLGEYRKWKVNDKKYRVIPVEIDGKKEFALYSIRGKK